MRLPRDVGGGKLSTLLRKFGYQVTRQSGSHMRLTSTLKGTEHHITVPKHTPLKLGTLNNIIKDVSSYLEIEKRALIDKLFG